MKLFYSTAAVSSAFAALANTLWFLYESGGGRIRDTGLWHLFRFMCLQLGFDPLRSLPGIFRRYHDLTSWSDLPTFLLLAIASNMIVGLVVALLASLLFALLSRVKKRASGERRAPSLKAALIATVCLAPAVLIPAAWIARLGLHLAHWGLAALISSGIFLAGCAVVFTLLFRRPSAERLLRKQLKMLVGVAGVLVITVVATAIGEPVVTAGSPNILLISIDSLRRDHVSAYGYKRPTTPQIDALAREGVLFDMAVAPTSWTLPSHVTMLTALPARLHAVRETNQRFSRDVVTLAEVLSDTGYATAGFVAGSFLSSTHGFGQGFDVYNDYTILERERGKLGSHLTSPLSVGLVRRWLDDQADADQQRPFFVFLHMWDVHYEYLPPPPYDTMFDPDYTGDITGRGFMDDPRINRDMPPRDREHLVALYDGEIRYTDDHLGQLFDLLAERGILDETIVVVTADHGDEFFEHGRKGHAETLFDEVLLVPLIMRYPAGIPAGSVVDRQVRLLDVAPTILSLAGVERPEKFGYCGPAVSACRDLTPFISGQSSDKPGLVAFGHLRRDQVSIRTETSKLIRDTRFNRARRYDLTNDPAERSNLYGSDDPQANTLLGNLLDQWWSGEVGKPQSTEIDAQQLEILRSLGYLK
jgi:arylsulfatase A-like enzyme